MTGLVLKKNADKFDVMVNEQVFTCVARNLKEKGIFVGDKVEIDENNTIYKVLERKNLLIRPPLANLDTMIIVVALIPKPDFLLVDKLIIFCTVNGIKPVLCLNKKDLSQDFIKEVKESYQKVCELVVISTFDSSVQELKKHICGITALAGQSAVGKSSIINALLGEDKALIGSFSKKVDRGKQTTRLVQLYEIEKGKFLADTAGFSKLDESLLNIDEFELKSYYPEFIEPAYKCKYKSCLHLTSKDCGVYEAVKSGEISKLRYENYKILQDNLKRLKKFWFILKVCYHRKRSFLWKEWLMLLFPQTQ